MMHGYLGYVSLDCPLSFFFFVSSSSSSSFYDVRTLKRDLEKK